MNSSEDITLLGGMDIKIGSAHDANLEDINSLE